MVESNDVGHSMFEKYWKDVCDTKPLVQDKYELMCLFSIMKDVGVQDYLAVGSSQGISLYMLAHA